MRKVNIDTDIRLPMTAATRQYLFENPSKFDPRDFLKVARKAATELCKDATSSSVAKAWPPASSRSRSTSWPPATPTARFARTCSNRESELIG